MAQNWKEVPNAIEQYVTIQTETHTHIECVREREPVQNSAGGRGKESIRKNDDGKNEYTANHFN